MPSWTYRWIISIDLFFPRFLEIGLQFLYSLVQTSLILETLSLEFVLALRFSQSL